MFRSGEVREEGGREEELWSPSQSSKQVSIDRRWLALGIIRAIATEAGWLAGEEGIP